MLHAPLLSNRQLQYLLHCLFSLLLFAPFWSVQDHFFSWWQSLPLFLYWFLVLIGVVQLLFKKKRTETKLQKGREQKTLYGLLTPCLSSKFASIAVFLEERKMTRNGMVTVCSEYRNFPTQMVISNIQSSPSHQPSHLQLQTPFSSLES